ncbi:MAG TPA: hypothetical protein VLI44_03245 [Sporolactobacillaceae bacterium]|nr:hypothetical protein [Sporolactobacillaceae bacterium]
MLDRYGLLGAGSGIAIALYVFSLIEKRIIQMSDPARSIRPPNRADGDGMLSLVFITEWVMVAFFVFAEILPGGFQTWLKASAVWCGASLATLYVIWVMGLKRFLPMNSQSAEKTAPGHGPRRRRLKGGIRSHD